MGRYKEHEICKFLELYKRNECLWRRTHKHYGLKPKRNEAYMRVRDAMNLGSVLEVKQKIKSFRDTYASERGKVRRSAMIAKHPNEIYKPKLRWYSLADSFLNNPKRNAQVTVPEAIIPINTTNIPPQEPEAIYSGLQQTHPTCKIKFIKRNNQGVDEYQQQLPQVHVPHVPAYHQLSQDSRSVQSQTEANNENHIQQRGEFYHFGMNIAMQLSSLPLVQALNIQTKIQQILCEERIAYAERCNPVFEDHSMFEEPPASSFVVEQTDFKDECISLDDEEEDQDIKENFTTEEVAMGCMPSVDF